MLDPLLAAVERLRARRDSPPPFCPGAIGAKPHDIFRCPACRLAKLASAQYDREHPPVPLGGPPEVLEAVADLLWTLHRHLEGECACEDLAQCFDDIETASHALASHLTEGSTTP